MVIAVLQDTLPCAISIFTGTFAAVRVVPQEVSADREVLEAVGCPPGAGNVVHPAASPRTATAAPPSRAGDRQVARPTGRRGGITSPSCASHHAVRHRQPEGQRPA